MDQDVGRLARKLRLLSCDAESVQFVVLSHVSSWRGVSNSYFIKCNFMSFVASQRGSRRLGRRESGKKGARHRALVDIRL